MQVAEPSAGFQELNQMVRSAGLLDLRAGRYIVRLVVNALFLGAGVAAFFLVGDSWWTLAVAAYLAFWRTQSGFMWHDAGHKAMFDSKAATTLMGYLHANLINGVSYGWWVNHHNRHHSFPNHLELDPDIARRTVIFDISQYPSRRGRQRLVVRHQGVLFFVLLVLEGLKLHRTAVRAVLAGNLKHRWTEAVLLLVHAGVVLGCLFTVLSPGKAVVFLLVHQALFGVYLGLLFAPNHKGMPVRSDEESLDWLERQVLTSRNIRPARWISFVYGGLNYQIEHHLFPTMPRGNLHRAAPIVKEYCARRGLPYLEVGMVASYRQVARYLHEVSEPVRRGTTGPTRPAGQHA
ncbi:MAG TPA: acyl-CoA desaturase [Pilimelia sp.]|nr:acyl-CoA desaturase [Pilimelia sp.]